MLGKLKSAILKGGGDGTSRTLSPSPPQMRGPRPVSSGAPYVRPPGKQLIPVDSIQLNKTLGEGEFGVVQQGVWTTETGEKLQVAVKKLSRERINTGTQNFLKEAAIMQELDHDHIVRMFGVVLDTDDNLMMVTELAPMRSLLECLKDPTLRVDLPVPRLCDYAQQVCDAMSYLESRRLVHRDLAARNILVFSKNQVKVSDLGLSRILGAGQDYYQSKFSVSLKLPIAWCAPECINFLKFTSASDVWAFGVMLWEFFTYGFQPWAGLNGQQILEAIDEPNCQVLEQPDLCTNEIYKLMKECWTHNPEERPTFSDILLRLPQLRPTQVKALKDYPNPTVEKGYMYYKAGDIIVVIDKSPATSSPPGLVWRGVLCNGKTGLFDPTNVVPFIEPKISPVAAKTTSLARKESNRKSGRKIRADMISHPQNDLRHTGHIGYDGAVFGDVSFIGDNYDKLPIKVEGASRGSSVMSLSRAQDSPDRNGHVRSSNSQDSLDRDKNGYGRSWISQESLNSQSTFHSEGGRHSPSYLDVEDDSLFSDFKMPDLGSSFDFGPSFMDEVLKALDEKEKQVTSSSDSTPTANQGPSFEADLKSSGVVAPTPAPRESRSSSSSAPPLPSQPPRVEPPKEKKQAKVKPMSASEERMVDTCMARAAELTSHMIRGSTTHSPPVSPGQEGKSSFFDEEPGILSRLKNSMKRSPKGERKRTFSDELESKGDLNDEVTPEAQQAYNMLVVKGSFKEKSSSSSQRHSGSPDISDVPKPTSRNAARSSQDSESSGWSEPDLIRDSKRGTTPPKISAPIVISAPQLPSATITAGSSPSPPVPSSRPVISAPQLQTKPVGVSQPKTAPSSAPVPAPRPAAKPDPSKKSEIPVPRPRPEIQRVEPTIRQTAPASPDIPPKSDKKIESHIPVPASKEREREELKRTIEIVRVDDSSSLRDDASERASTSFERSSARSSQRSSLDRSDNTSENAESERADWEHSECSSDGSKPGRDGEPRAYSSQTSVERKDSFNKKQTSLFEEDFSEPSPQEIMSKLRERRLNRHLDHQRAIAGEGEGSSAVTASRPRPSAREPQGIPGRTPSVDDENGGGEGGDDEVDTNPLRMLRGGAIPIRTAGRGSAGTSNHGNRGAQALRVPQLNFSSHLSRSVTDHQNAMNSQERDITNPGKAGVSAQIADREGDCAAAELTRELEKLTNTLMGGDFSQVANMVVADTHRNNAEAAQGELRKFSSSGLQMDLGVNLPEAESNQKAASATTTGVERPPAIPPKETFSPPRDTTTPPRLPPRRSQSLSENPESDNTQSTRSARMLRRSNSVEEDSREAPALPPRDPQPGRTPLNIPPRTRKYPLLAQSPESKSQQPSSPRLVSPTVPTSKLPQHSMTTHMSTLPSAQQPPTPTLPSRQHSGTHPHLHHSVSLTHTSRSPSHTPPRQTAIHSPLMTRSLDSASGNRLLQYSYHSQSVELPPAYDISIGESDSVFDVADSEPTHMLLDPHTPHLPLPLAVNLPPASDLTIIDEPTHINLSSITDNKHSWSNTVTSPSPLSPSFQHRHQNLSVPSHGSQSKTFNRSLSHTYGQNQDSRVHRPQIYPEFSDNQSPPADLPPAPPTPSYREKFGLSQKKPNIMRSLSTGRTPSHQPGSHLLGADLHQITTRGRSASATSPTTHHHQPTNSLLSPSHSSSHHFFRYPSHNFHDDDSDDAFFAEAPSVPHPYSQSPFHPIVTTTIKDSSSSSSLIYSTVVPQQPPSSISPYQVSAAVLPPRQSTAPSKPSTLSVPQSDSGPPISPRTSSRRVVENYIQPPHTLSPHTQDIPPPISPRTTSIQTYNPSSTPSSPPPPLSPRNSSRTAMENYRSLSQATTSTTQVRTAPPQPSNPSTKSPNPGSAPRAASQQNTLLVFKYPSVGPNQNGMGLSSSSSSAAAAQSNTLGGERSATDISPTADYPSSSEVSPLMFASYSKAASVSYEDLRQFALDRQENCEEIETLLKIFPNEVTVEECMTALEGTQWDVNKATKYLQLKKLLSLGVADIHKCKEALSTHSWDLQRAADSLLESARAISSSSSSSVSSSTRGSPARSGTVPSRNRPASPEIVDV